MPVKLILTIVIALVMCGCQDQPQEVTLHRQNSMTAIRPLGSQQDISEYNNAMRLVASLDYASAARKFSVLIRRFELSGNAEYSAKSTFWLGYCYEKQGGSDEAAAFYKQVIRKYPDLRVAKQAADRLDRIQQAEKKAAAAVRQNTSQ